MQTMNSYEQTLREMRHGRSLAELSEQLALLVAAVRDTGKAGSLAYKITVKPASAGDVVTVQLEDDVIPKLPKAALAPNTPATVARASGVCNAVRSASSGVAMVMASSWRAPPRIKSSAIFTNGS